MIAIPEFKKEVLAFPEEAKFTREVVLKLIDAAEKNAVARCTRIVEIERWEWTNRDLEMNHADIEATITIKNCSYILKKIQELEF